MVAACCHVGLVFEQQSHDCGISCGCCLVQRSVSASLRGIDVCSGLEQETRALDGAAKRDGGMQSLIAHGIVRNQVNMGSVLKEELDRLRCGEGRREVQRRPAIGRDSTGLQSIGGDELMKTGAFAQCRGFMYIQFAGAGAQNVADEWLAGVHGPEQGRHPLRVAAPRQFRRFFHGGGDLGDLSPANHIEEELTHVNQYKRCAVKMQALHLIEAEE